MAHYTLIARINAGHGKFPFANVQFSRNHRPIPIKGATYYLRPNTRGKRTPIKIGKDVGVAHTALIHIISAATPRKTPSEGGGENHGDVAVDEGMMRHMTSENVYHPAADHEDKSAGERSACPFCFLGGIG